MGDRDVTMAQLLRLCGWIDAITTRVGQVAAWAVLAAVVVSAANAVSRKVFGASSNMWLELQPLLFGCVFLLCAPWALKANAHIRIDVLSGRLSKRTRDWIDVIGHGLFLIPLAAVMVWTGWPYFLRSWVAGEQSTNPGGLAQYPGKLLVVLGFALLLAQGVSELIKRVAILRGGLVDDAVATGQRKI